MNSSLIDDFLTLKEQARENPGKFFTTPLSPGLLFRAGLFAKQQLARAILYRPDGHLPKVDEWQLAVTLFEYPSLRPTIFFDGLQATFSATWSITTAPKNIYDCFPNSIIETIKRADKLFALARFANEPDAFAMREQASELYNRLIL